MSYTLEDLRTAKHHVAEAERHVLRQEAIVTELEGQGANTLIAKELLAEFNRTLQAHRDDRDKIAAQLEVPT